MNAAQGTEAGRDAALKRIADVHDFIDGAPISEGQRNEYHRAVHQAETGAQQNVGHGRPYTRLTVAEQERAALEALSNIAQSVRGMHGRGEIDTGTRDQLLALIGDTATGQFAFDLKVSVHTNGGDEQAARRRVERLASELAPQLAQFISVQHHDVTVDGAIEVTAQS